MIEDSNSSAAAFQRSLELISCTILSIVYVVLAYISPLVGLRLIGSDAEKISSMAFCALVLPFLAGIGKAVYIRINRQ